MQVELSKSETFGTVAVPSSKSFAHRLLIASFLSGERTEIFGSFDVGDIQTTANCLKSMGGEIELTKDRIVINGKKIKDCALNVLDSGSTLRFLLPIVSALGIVAKFVGTERLANRPISKLLDTLRENGGIFSSDALPIVSSGKLVGGDYVIDGSESSQYVTGLLLALPILDKSSNVIIKGKTVSSNYIDITLDVLKQFSIKVKKTQTGYFVEGGQKYVSPKTIRVEGDWSSACFFAVLGAINGEVTVENVNLNSVQGDKVVVDVLKKAGVSIIESTDKFTVKKSVVKQFDFDAENYPDIVPILSVLASFSDGVCCFKNVSRLKEKESDRLSGIVEMLKKFSIKAEERNECLFVLGGKPESAEYDSPNDHRMTMSASVLAVTTRGISAINGAECVKKSYQEFFEHLKQIGGNVCIIHSQT